MKFAILAIAILAAVNYSNAILCWKCDNALDNDDCLATGREISCKGNQHGCQTEARYHQGLLPPIRITKRCKQGLACDNNVFQNEKGFFPFQCNPHIPESICRCCCDTDFCNKPLLGCLPDFPTCRELIVPENGVMECHFGTLPPSVGENCRFKCDEGYDLVGAEELNCEALTRKVAKWDDKEPTCEPRKCMPEYTNLKNGYVSCTNFNFVGSVCTHECDPGFAYDGNLVANCMTSQNWDYPQPKCIPITCPPPMEAPVNGDVDCTNGNREGSTCSFTCEDGFALIGEPVTDCLDDFNNDQFGVWTDPVPKCVALMCPPQSRHPDDGKVSCTNYNYGGSRCSYTCEPGFAIKGAPERDCVDDGDGDDIGMWTEEEPTCEPITCNPEHVNPTNGYVVCTDQNKLDSVCDFYCYAGNKLIGSALSICEDDGDGDELGRWSDPPPSCTGGPCEPELSDPLHGKVTCTDRNNIRSMCTFECDSGYYMASEAGDPVRSSRFQVLCTTQMLWDKQPPVCLPIKCNPPHRESDSLAVLCSDDNNYMSNCKFSCKDGSRPDGPQQSVCNDDGNGDSEGVWVPPTPPTCRPQFCQPPQVHPQNGRVTCSNRNMHGSICTFVCKPGFYLQDPGRKPVGSTEYNVECEGTIWNKRPPICAPIVCLPKHTNPENGAVRCSRDNNYLSRCDFTCDLGYEMTGSKRSTCEDDQNGDAFGEWSAPPPTCTSSGCAPPLRAPDNGEMSCTDGNNYRSVCTFKCNVGYYMVAGSGKSVTINNLKVDCQATNLWSDTEPTCRPITCPPPRSDPKNGEVSCTNDINYRSVCTYVCDSGFELSTKFPTTVCEDDGNGDSNGVWSRPPPQCTPTNCIPKQSPPTNGKVSCTNANRFGSICRFTCNAGYYMLDNADTMIVGGRDSTECLAGNKWSKPAPKCAPITCPPPQEDPDSGSVVCSNRNMHKSKCSFKCNPGYDLSGSPATTCEADDDNDEFGAWSKPPPRCILGACKPPLKAPSNGKIFCSDGTSVGSICTVECNSGYYMLNGKIIKQNLLDIECKPNNAWSSKPPSCQPIRCKPPHSKPKDGSVSCSNSNFYASECTFTCAVGFKLIPPEGSVQTGTYFSVCEEDDVPGDENGDWSDPPPTCQRDICNPPREAPENGKISCTNTNMLGSTCTYSCNSGFYMQFNEKTLTKNRHQTECLKDLTWSQGPPVCLPIICRPVQTDPENGAVECTNENYHLSVCSFTCEGKFVLQGSPRTKCLDDGDGNPFGEWSEPPPTCSKNFCDPAKPKDPINGSKVCDDSNNLGSTCEFVCDDYHRRKGPLYSKCVKNARGELEWTNPPPECLKNECEDREDHEFAHGTMDCTKKNCATSVCSYTCTQEGYSLYPAGIDTNTCQNNTKWDRRKPCCTRPCPPNAEMDCIVVLDSSSSVGKPNWAIMKSFVYSILSSFTVAPDTTNFGIFRYNAVVDEKTRIFLKDYPADITGLLEAYDKIPYDGSGTKTAQALNYVKTTMLRKSNGNRPLVPDLVIVLTDGKSQDAVGKVSDDLRAMGAFLFCVGIKPPRGDLDMEQLLQIAGSEENLMIADGFDGLNTEFALQLTDKVCGDPCIHRTHRGEVPP